MDDLIPGETMGARTPPPRSRPLKLIVAATPKTGNNWIKHLLSEIYGLRPVDLQPDFRADDWAKFGERWVGHQHYMPDAELRERAREQGVQFVTMLRHPADVLVSLRHYVEKTQTPAKDPRREASMLLDEPGRCGEHTRRYVEHGFYLTLHTSICWMHIPGTVVVHYEDLWAQPLATLREVTGRIEAVGDGTLEAAIAACRIERMRAAHGATLFRRGGSGAWRTELPHEIQHCLATWSPYPMQLATMGYTMAATGGSGKAEAERFDNGTPIPPFLREAYARTATQRVGGWPVITATGPGSFYAWLNTPAAADPWRGAAFPVITELAYHTYQMRPDAQAEYADPFGRHRVDFGNWFIFFGAGFCGLDEIFTLPMLGEAQRPAGLAKV